MVDDYDDDDEIMLSLTEDGRCPWCGLVIPIEDAERHLDGMDARRMACGHQDLTAIKDEQRAYERRWRGYVW